jgi:hypothetical protein
MGGGQAIPSNTTSTTAPWPGQQTYLMGNPAGVNAPGGYSSSYTPGSLPAAAALYGDTSAWPKFYPGVSGITSPLGPTYVPMNENQKALSNELQGFGFSQGSPQLNDAMKANASLMTQSTDPWSDPSFSSVVNNTIASTMPQITSTFNAGNRLDSGLAQSDTAQGVSNAVGNLALGQFNQNVQNQLRGEALAPMLDQTQIGDIQTGLNAAGLNQQDLQNQVNSGISQWNYNQMLPWNMLGLYGNAIGGNYGSSGSVTTPYYTNQGANILGGVTGALGLANAGAQAAGYSSLIPMIASIFA